MRSIVYSFPATDFNSIAATQNITATDGGNVVINGPLSNFPQFANAGSHSQRATLPGIQRTIGVFSTGNLSAVVFYASGLDLGGRVVTASFLGATGGSSSASNSFATFTVEFNVVNNISATSAATSNFAVGVGATGVTNWTQMDTFKSPFAVTVAAAFTGTGSILTVQDTPDDVNTATAPTAYSHATMVSLTANLESSYAFPARFVRGSVSGSSATGAATLSIQQAG